ncbi:cytochrome P450 [Aspergillus multicolor]|uniref:cytochrome P450 n=1 Tax=Aspergillus multicolor TaxID=41759 RepID=UPI003CCC920A
MLEDGQTPSLAISHFVIHSAIMLKLVVLLAAAYLAYELASRLRNRKPLPPGPPPLPLIGNLHQHPTDQPWVQYRDWHRKYGPVITVKMGIRTVIFLGSHKAVDDILTKRGKVYCSPPNFAFFGECMTGNSLPVLLPQGAKRRDIHRLVSTILTPKACQAYSAVQERESLRLMRGLLAADGNNKYSWGYSVGVTSTLIYGERMGEVEEAEIGDIEALFNGILDVVSKENVALELYPFLNMLPRRFNRWKKAGDEFRQHFIKLWGRRMRRGLKNRNWNWSRLFHDNKPIDMSEEQLLFCIAELEIGAAISTASLIRLFIATAVRNPGATQRVREEIDRVVGTDRLPCLDDQEKLPLLHAFFNEMTRWKAAFPLSLPYTGLEDGEYSGYRIPKDALVIANQWALNMDPDVFIHPEIFRPERWIENPDLPKPSIFGYGRRVCPGEQFGTNSMFIAFSRMLWAFDTKPSNKGIGSDEAHTALGMIAESDTDGVKFIPRDENRRRVLEGMLKDQMFEDKQLLDNASKAVRMQLATPLANGNGKAK